MNVSQSSYFSMAGANNRLLLRPPSPEDGAAIHQLIEQSPPLDVNSCYAYLLQTVHFADTCVVAKDSDNTIAAYISAYIPPKKSNTLFVWQVAVAEAYRGQRLAAQMIQHLLRRPVCAAVQYIETTVSPSNQSSAKLFKHLAAQLNAPCVVSELFSAELFGHGTHEAEELFRIGAFCLAH